MEIRLSLSCHSLKEKRGIVKSMLGRSRNRFNVSCAETDRQDNPGVAELGFVTLSSNKLIARSTLERLENWLYENWPDVEIRAADIAEI